MMAVPMVTTPGGDDGLLLLVDKMAVLDGRNGVAEKMAGDDGLDDGWAEGRDDGQPKAGSPWG
jgi:hypothetical protein